MAVFYISLFKIALFIVHYLNNGNKIVIRKNVGVSLIKIFDLHMKLLEDVNKTGNKFGLNQLLEFLTSTASLFYFLEVNHEYSSRLPKEVIEEFNIEY